MEEHKQLQQFTNFPKKVGIYTNHFKLGLAGMDTKIYQY